VEAVQAVLAGVEISKALVILVSLAVVQVVAPEEAVVI
jgi:hypothetical protein